MAQPIAVPPHGVHSHNTTIGGTIWECPKLMEWWQQYTGLPILHKSPNFVYSLHCSAFFLIFIALQSRS